MPPKAKYSKSEIQQKAVEIVMNQGYEKLTARELAAALGTSVRPIFTAFKNMNEVKQACFDYALEKYHSYFAGGLGENPFKTIGINYIRFSIDEPQLFKLIFLQSQDETIPFVEYMKKLDDCYEDSLKLVSQSTGLSSKDSEFLYQHMWIYSTGIATLCATKQCKFSDEMIERMLDEAFLGIAHEIKSKNHIE